MSEAGVPAPPPETPPAPAARIGLLARLRNWFLAGVVVTAPIGLTIYFTYLLVSYVDRNVVTLLPEEYRPDRYLPFEIPGTGVVIALATLTLIGFLTANIIGRALLRLGERLVERMPIVRGIYSALKQVFETVFAQKGTSFRQVVMVEFPKPGIWSLGFLTNEQTGEVGRRLGDEVIAVFVPMTPNPMSGFLIYARRREVTMLAMTVEDAWKLILSGGVVTARDRPLKAPPPHEPVGD